MCANLGGIGVGMRQRNRALGVQSARMVSGVFGVGAERRWGGAAAATATAAAGGMGTMGT